MDIYAWIFMDIMDIYDIYGYLWIFMDIYGMNNSV